MNKTIKLYNSCNGSYIKIYINKKGLNEIKKIAKTIDNSVKEIKINNPFTIKFLNANKKIIDNQYRYYDYIIINKDSYYFCFAEEGNISYVYTENLILANNE